MAKYLQLPHLSMLQRRCGVGILLRIPSCGLLQRLSGFWSRLDLFGLETGIVEIGAIGRGCDG